MLTMILQTIAAGVGTIAFCVLFRVPQKYFLNCGWVGMVQWVVYLFINYLTQNSTAAVFCAALTIISMSRYYAVKKKCPLTIFLVTGIFPLVPGAGIYRTVYYVSTELYTLALREGLTALKAAFAIAIAIAIGLRIPTKVFLMLNKEKKPV